MLLPANLFTANLFTANLFTANLFTANLLTANLLTANLLIACMFIGSGQLYAQDVNSKTKQDERNSVDDYSAETLNALGITRKIGLFQPLTEPPCSYCVDQNAKGFIKQDDMVLAWIRGVHNGGAFSIRHFISKYRVINDTYGLFFYDPDGGYVSAFKKDYGYKFYGWRGGVMVAQSRDGTLWSALSGRAILGPQKGTKLKRVPSMTTLWSHWLMLHPESTAYDLFDGKRYEAIEFPTQKSKDSMATIGKVDSRLGRFSKVIGVESNDEQLAFVLDDLEPRAVKNSRLDGKPIVMFWYGKTNTAVVFDSMVDGKQLNFFADGISPATAPFKDKETGTRWTLAGRAVDGPLRGKELTWHDSIQCNWYAWSFEYPKTKIYNSGK